MILYIVRHGLSERNVDASCVQDCELTKTGRKQAQQAAEWLADKNIDYLYTSPAIRTLQTSNIIGDYLNMRPRVWLDIIEHGFLEHEPGLTQNEITQRFSSTIVDSLAEGGAGCASHMNGESIEKVCSRAEAFKRELFAKYLDTQKNICLVTHGGFSNYFLGTLLNIDMRDGQTYFLHNNCGISCLELSPGDTTLFFANYHGHLSDVT